MFGNSNSQIRRVYFLWSSKIFDPKSSIVANLERQLKWTRPLRKQFSEGDKNTCTQYFGVEGKYIHPIPPYYSTAFGNMLLSHYGGIVLL